MSIFEKISGGISDVFNKSTSPISDVFNKTLGTILRPITDFIKLEDIMKLTNKYKNIAGIHDFLGKLPYISSYIHDIDTITNILDEISKGNYYSALKIGAEYGIQSEIEKLVPLKYRLADKLMSKAIEEGLALRNKKFEKQQEDNKPHFIREDANYKYYSQNGNNIIVPKNRSSNTNTIERQQTELLRKINH